ncbi:MAG: hypothetical protein GY791_08250 [Alphaproteobacteria bacterium]|nr:hypothetical protein [Alphaproteobacteria bacterium]
MANLYIREYAYLARDENGGLAQIGSEPAQAGQSVSFTTSSQSAAFQADTRFIRIIADADAYLDFGASPTAAVADGLLVKANEAEYFGVVPGHKVAAYDGTS